MSSSLQARDEIHRNTDEIERIYNKVRLGQIRLDWKHLKETPSFREKSLMKTNLYQNDWKRKLCGRSKTAHDRSDSWWATPSAQLQQSWLYGSLQCTWVRGESKSNPRIVMTEKWDIKAKIQRIKKGQKIIIIHKSKVTLSIYVWASENGRVWV